MSKLFWERNDSTAAYVYTARKLSIRIKLSCANANHKKYTFYGLQDLSHYSSELCRMCNQIDKIYPTNRVEADARMLLIKNARGMLYTISSLFGECVEIIGFKEGVLQEVSDLIEQEDRLLAGLKKSDTARFKHLR